MKMKQSDGNMGIKTQDMEIYLVECAQEKTKKPMNLPTIIRRYLRMVYSTQ